MKNVRIKSRIFVLLKLIIFINLISCYQSDSPLDSKIPSEKKKTSSEKESTIYNQVEFLDSLILPEGFYLDSSIFYNEGEALEINYILIKSHTKSTSKILDQIYLKMKELIDVQRREILDRLKDNPDVFKETPGNAIALYPDNLFLDSTHLSMTMILYVYHSGAPHGYSKYYSYNYDLVNQKMILFKDYFEFKNSSDSIELKSKIESQIKNTPLGNISKYDFLVEGDCVKFNFGDYACGSYFDGMRKATIKKDELKNIIRKEYQ